MVGALRRRLGGAAAVLGDPHPDPATCQHADLIVLAGLDWPGAHARLRGWRASGLTRPVVLGLAEAPGAPERRELDPVTIVAPPLLEEAVQTELLSMGGQRCLRLAACEVDLSRRTVARGGATIPLTALEARLLAWLAARPNRDISRDELLAGVWGYQRGVATRAVDMTVSRLRRKIERDSGGPDHVQASRGGGYRFVPTRVLPNEAPPTRFFGRADELRALGSLYAEGRRVVALVGPPGVGKSRLAREHLREHPGGLWCDLERAADTPELLGAVARALGLSTSGLAAAEQPRCIGDALRAQEPGLLVLDPVEHLLDGLWDTLAVWLEAAPRLRILLGSRVRLPADAVLEVAPLPLEAARALFLDRAAARGPAADDPDLDPLIELLDRLPLALELAAARAHALAPGDLRARLGGCLDLLCEGPDSRQRSLRGALAWSWSLLDPEARDALTRLSVFPDGFSLEAAEAVLGPGPRPPVAALAELVERSLVQRLPHEGRYRLLWSVRTFAGAEGPAATLAEAGLRHAAWFAALAARGVAELVGPHAIRAQQLLEREQASLRVAWARSAGDAGLLVALTEALDAVWSAVGSLDQRVALAEATLVHLPAVGTARARCLLLRARALFSLSRVAEANADFRQAAVIAEDPRVRCLALVLLASNLRRSGQFDEARVVVAAARQAVEGTPAIQAPVEAEEALLTCLSETEPSRLQEACLRLADAARLLLAEGNHQFGAVAWQHLIAAYDHCGEPEKALRVSEERWPVMAGRPLLESRLSWSYVRVMLYLRLGRFADAVETAEPLLRQAQASGLRWMTGMTLAAHGTALHGIGRTAEAFERWESARAEGRRSGATRLSLVVNFNMTLALLELGRSDQARALLAEARRELTAHNLTASNGPVALVEVTLSLLDGRITEAHDALRDLPWSPTWRAERACAALLQIATHRALGQPDEAPRAALAGLMVGPAFGGQAALRGALLALDRRDDAALAVYALPPAPPLLRVTVGCLRALARKT